MGGQRAAQTMDGWAIPTVQCSLRPAPTLVLLSILFCRRRPLALISMESTTCPAPQSPRKSLRSL